jgi:hypothetical protein
MIITDRVVIVISKIEWFILSLSRLQIIVSLQHVFLYHSVCDLVLAQ